MFYGRFTDPNALRRGVNRPNATDANKPVLDNASGNAASDGYTRLSQADRESGFNPPCCGEPAYPRRPVE